MRKLAIVLALLAVLSLPTASSAHADGFGLGFFLGEPTGLDLKIDLQRRSALDIVLGITSIRNRDPLYAHLTYLVTPFMGEGTAVRVPLRLGIGAAIYGNDNDVNAGVRVPVELGLWFRRTPLEIYGELALLLTLIDDNDNYDRLDLQGGVGLRFYF
jgi:hypothetical protein